MSARVRAEGEKLKRKYAHTFNVPLEDIEWEEWDDEVRVSSKVDRTLPKWSTGTKQ